MSSELQVKIAPPLPRKLEDWHRFLKTKRTMNDLVEDVHRALISEESDRSEEYLNYLRAVGNDQAVEGSMIADDFEAARIIREYALEHGPIEVAKANKTTIRKALNVVARRYHASRKQRALMLNDQMVALEDAAPGEAAEGDDDNNNDPAD